MHKHALRALTFTHMHTRTHAPTATHDRRLVASADAARLSCWTFSPYAERPLATPQPRPGRWWTGPATPSLQPRETGSPSFGLWGAVHEPGQARPGQGPEYSRPQELRVQTDEDRVRGQRKEKRSGRSSDTGGCPGGRGAQCPQPGVEATDQPTWGRTASELLCAPHPLLTQTTLRTSLSPDGYTSRYREAGTSGHLPRGTQPASRFLGSTCRASWTPLLSRSRCVSTSEASCFLSSNCVFQPSLVLTLAVISSLSVFCLWRDQDADFQASVQRDRLLRAWSPSRQLLRPSTSAPAGDRARVQGAQATRRPDLGTRGGGGCSVRWCWSIRRPCRGRKGKGGSGRSDGAGDSRGEGRTHVCCPSPSQARSVTRVESPGAAPPGGRPFLAPAEGPPSPSASAAPVGTCHSCVVFSYFSFVSVLM